MISAVYRIVHLALGLGAVRAALAATGFVVALAAGAERGPAAWVRVRSGGQRMVLVSDRRRMLGKQLHPVPHGVEHRGLPRAVAQGLLPSTVVVSVLLAIALAFEPVLSAVLAGVLAGMVLAGLVTLTDFVVREYRQGMLFYADATDSSRRYAVPR